jgi:predicted nuclease of predicted toxin-antitoxin system
VGDLGLLGATDVTVMEAAASSERVLVSADTDFGELLAVGRDPGPSVIILRRMPHRPEAQTELLLANLGGIEETLAAGAVVVLSGENVRFRLLPINREP